MDEMEKEFPEKLFSSVIKKFERNEKTNSI